MSPPAAATPAAPAARKWTRVLTARGWALVVIAIILLATGVLVHLDELFPFAVAAAVLVVTAVVWVRCRSWAVEGHRMVTPLRVPLGGLARVDLTVTNRGNRTSPVLAARDPFDNGRRFARFALAPLAPGATVQASYRLPTTRRGVFPLGPLEFRLHDPLGLAFAYRASGRRSQLCVHPAIERLPSMEGRFGAPDSVGDSPGRTSHHGTEFYALREYQVGDDLRRVHWTSSARRDQLMIRQDHDVTQPRTLLVGDVRPTVHSAGSLERTLSALASLADAALRGGHTVRLVLAGAPAAADSGWGYGTAHRVALLDLLATAVPPGAEPPPAARAARRRMARRRDTAGADTTRRSTTARQAARREAAGGQSAGPDAAVLRRARFDAGRRDATVVVTTDGAEPGDLAPPPEAAADAAPTTIVVIEREGSGQRAPTSAGSVPAGVLGIRVPDGASFAAVWGRLPGAGGQGRRVS